MPVIRAHAGLITQINVFTVPVGRQQDLIEHLTAAVSFSFAREEPG